VGWAHFECGPEKELKNSWAFIINSERPFRVNVFSLTRYNMVPVCLVGSGPMTRFATFKIKNYFKKLN